ncbi:DNA-binding transcriptional regulator, AcrR family [Amycolatopsis sacchari]|uniref:DNA-binding transcriptional regulator, AcrR family n=1 Tax=Amycolatopsis sacchari TaxID=115433 RepID=A0A1I3RZK7_9PSEU|nr:TetR/AcrR family transcriptional regulator [Amycolatopsis sacchari]SFJ51905.1 DNA-binding transcriptional regulator, AcrR family [Amycolatopsis sacchari]
MTATGLRERKKEATRQALRHAAITLYREHGPQSVTVEDICAKAGVSPRTFFNYFECKDDAVLSLDLSIATLGRRIIERPAEENPLTALRAVFAARFAEMTGSETFRERTLLLREYPELMNRLAHTNKTIEETVVRAIADRTGLPADDVYVRTTAAAAFAANRTAIASWQPGEGPDLVTLLHQAMDVLERGLTPPPPG